MKSLCIKTNNSKLQKYLLNELNSINLENVYFSQNHFKHYDNIIVHYLGSNYNDFVSKLSSILSFLIIDEVEEELLNKIILQNYFYFNSIERKSILDICFDINYEDFCSLFNTKFDYIYNQFSEYIINHKSIVINGFITFRLPNYLDILNNIVEQAVNTFVIEKEYMEFISLLKLYIASQSTNSNIIHLMYSSNESILLDEYCSVIDTTINAFNAKYLGDISFSSNDYTLNALLNLLPKKLYIHLLDGVSDEFINTLRQIFENKIELCYNCDLCKKYQKSIIPNKS